MFVIFFFFYYLLLFSFVVIFVGDSDIHDTDFDYAWTRLLSFKEARYTIIIQNLYTCTCNTQLLTLKLLLLYSRNNYN